MSNKSAKKQQSVATETATEQQSATEQQNGSGAVLEDVRNVRPISRNGDWRPSHKVLGDSYEDAQIDARFSVGGTAHIKQLHEMNTLFDFSECSREEILTLALRSCRIWVQRNWQEIAKSDLNAATRPGTYANVNVKRDILDTSRQTAPPTVAAAKALEKMSADERKAWLEAQLKELNGN